MKKINCCTVLLSFLLLGYKNANAQSLLEGRAPQPATLIPTKDELDARLAWWNNARFGMFIHWGVYSTLSGTWQGVQYKGYGEHIQRMAKIPIAEYKEKVAGTFNPTAFNAEEWVALAKAAGMKYLIITAKHHDGFAMFDSKASDYNIVKATPFGRDPMKELKAACTKAGIKFGFYYSHAFDWGEKNGVGNDWDFDNPGGDKLLGGSKWWETRKEFIPTAQKYVDEKAIPQILELINNYHPDILWFDTPHKLPDEENMRILAAIRKVDRKVVVNGRESKVLRDYDYNNTGDRPTEFQHYSGYWEGIPTTNNSYGYNANDTIYKPVSYFIQLLAKAAARGGNILMNIGPMGTGKVDYHDINILKGIGDWWKTNGESSIRGTNRSPLAVQAWGETTLKKDTLFLHVFQWPKNGQLVVGGLKATISNAFLLAHASTKLKSKQVEEDMAISVPKNAPDTADAVVALVCKGGIKSDNRILLQPEIDEQMLRAFDAKPSASLSYGTDRQAFIMNFKTLKDTISWLARLNVEADYEVIVNYSAVGQQKTNKLAEGDAGKELSKANSGAGGIYVLDFGGKRLTHKVSNGEKITELLGKVQLSKGLIDIHVTAESITGQELFRLRSIVLKRISK